MNSSTLKTKKNLNEMNHNRREVACLSQRYGKSKPSGEKER